MPSVVADRFPARVGHHSTDGDELLREGKRHGLGFNFVEAYVALFDASVALKKGALRQIGWMVSTDFGSLMSHDVDVSLQR